MTDESRTTDDETRSAADDPRFEVKWRKKESSAPAAETPGVTATEPSDDLNDLRRRLDEAEQRANDLRDRWQRAAADLVNLRKRTEQEKGETEKFASMMLVAELLPVLDNFERALTTIPGNLAMLTWVQGVMLIERHVRAILEHQGLAPIEADGQTFNPHLHEAIGERETDEVPAGTIVQVYQQGYTMHGRVIRPALVELATAPTRVEQATAPDSAGAPEGSAAEEIAEQAENENTGP